MSKETKKSFSRKLIILAVFMILSAISFSNTTTSGGTGIFDALFDFLKKLIIDYRMALIFAGILGVLGSIIGEIFMPDMNRTLKVVVSSLIALGIGIGAEIAVKQVGGSMLDSSLISWNSEYLKLIIGV